METKITKEILMDLHHIQQNLDVPKTRKASAPDGREFLYRSADDIMAAVKPLLKERRLVLSFNVTPTVVGPFIYITVDAILMNASGDCISASGVAREETRSARMSSPQETGSATTYATKYALNALFCLDDSDGGPSPDPDSVTTPKEEPKEDKGNEGEPQEASKKETKAPAPEKETKEPQKKEKPDLIPGTELWVRVVDRSVKQGLTPEALNQKIHKAFRITGEDYARLQFAVTGVQLEDLPED